MARIIALLLLVIPGIISGYGIKLMRDAVFWKLDPLFFSPWIQFAVGFVLFFAGLSFIAGFIFHRDRKRNKVQKRFQKKNASSS